MRSINVIIKELKFEYKDLTTYQLLDLATQMQRNEILEEHNNILESGLVVSKSNPSGLEAIAMQLGMSSSSRNITIIDALADISDNLGEIKTRIEEK